MEWLLATISSCYVCVDGFVADYFTIRHCDFNYKINRLFESDIRMKGKTGIVGFIMGERFHSAGLWRKVLIFALLQLRMR